MFARALVRTIARSAVKTTPLAALRVAAPRAALPAIATPAFRRFAHGVSDKDLSLKLAEELKYEDESSAEADLSFLEEFKSKGIWKVEDKPGSKDVTLTRTFGNEKITLYFNTDALTEQNIETEEEEEEGVPVVTSVIIEKPGVEGAIEITATAQDGAFFIDHVSFVKSPGLAHDQTAEGDWQRRSLFGGPIFGDLDESLQDVFHRYLEERGFDTGLANFVGLYIEDKEQREYRNWLASLNKFVSH
ncbi:Mitochondrial acidic protein mam33 [Polyrhizophydium stewartii]|uniref:Mitochondrial acidic protein mam33 n=1 Tax=Polyrhizophydium stewartii TaxID=2732419 RepID=A0ABR4NJN0_9FUNG